MTAKVIGEHAFIDVTAGGSIEAAADVVFTAADADSIIVVDGTVQAVSASELKTLCPYNSFAYVVSCVMQY